MNIRWPIRLPSSRRARLVLVVLLCLVLLAAALFIQSSRRGPGPVDTLVLGMRPGQIERLQRDSDGDGLKDWEEVIYQTDSDKSDTDGDGTPDGAEVAAGRDPARPNTSKKASAPSDLLATTTPFSPSDPRDPETNYTRDFTRQFLRKPVSEILSGGTPSMDMNAVNAYADRLTKKSVLADARRYTEKDIILDHTGAKDALEHYLDSYTDIFNALDRRGENEVDVAINILNAQNYALTDQLAEYPAAYQAAIAGLLALRVPEPLAVSHLATINTLSQFKRAVELMQKIESDPLLAILALRERAALSEKFSGTLANFRGQVVAELDRTQ